MKITSNSMVFFDQKTISLHYQKSNKQIRGIKYDFAQRKKL